MSDYNVANKEPELLFATEKDTEGFKNRLKESHLIEAFKGDIKRKGSSPFYMFGLFVVTILMILLPLLYLALIAAVGYLIYLHLIHDFGIITVAKEPRARMLATLIYLAPVGAGIIFLVFMVKPFFAKRSMFFQSVPLKREEEPLLFKFVEIICRKVGAPVPSVIEVDCMVNASAGPCGGLLTLLSRKLKLTIGLPLVTGLTMQEFAGVLGHEFGHFSQKAAMSMTYIIRSINSWFYRVVYERDSWDDTLRKLCGEIDIKYSFILYITRFLVWITRQILWVLMMISHIVSCFMLRQMEYDADYYESTLAGSDTFESTSKKIRNLGVAFEGVVYDLNRSWMEKRLGDNLPELIALKVEEIPEDVLKKYDEHQDKERTGLFYTHPTDRARIKKSKKINSPGIFNLSRPTPDLFKDFTKTAKLASLVAYSSALGSQVNNAALIPTEELVQRREKQRKEGQAMERYFQNIWTDLYPLKIDISSFEKPASYEELGAKLVQVRKQIKPSIYDAHQIMNLYIEDYNHMMDGLCAKEMASMGFKLNPSDFNVKSIEKEALNGHIAHANKSMEQSAVHLEKLSNLYRERLITAFKFLYNKNVTEALKTNNCSIEIMEVNKLLKAISKMGFALPMVDALRKDFSILNLLIQNIKGNEEYEPLMLKLRKYIKQCKDHIGRIQTSLNEEPYPFDHGAEKISVGRFIVNAVVFVSDSDAFKGAQTAINNFYDLYFRLLSTLAQIAENIEAALNLKPWPQPDMNKMQPPKQ